MFSLVTGIYDSYLAPSQLNLLVVGAPGVGKTTLLERLKVTQIPKRPSTRKDGGVVMEPPACIAQALQRGGAAPAVAAAVAAESSSLSSSLSLSSPPRQNNPAAPVLVAPPVNSSSSTTPNATDTPTTKRRFQFCPAPKRYQHSTEDDADDDEEFVDDGIVLSREESRPLVDNPVGDRSPEAPRRVRLHSKEFSINTLDLDNDVDNDGDNDNDDDGNDMQDVEIQEPAKHVAFEESESKSAPVAAAPTHSTIPLHQEEYLEQFHMKPKAKMLPMDKIRPTSKYNIML
jgi:hypothetical protein